MTAQSAFVSAVFENKMNVIQRKAETDLMKLKSAWESAGVKVADDKFKQHHKAIADLVGAVKELRRPVALFAVLVCLRNKEIMAATPNGIALRGQLKDAVTELQGFKNAAKQYRDVFDRTTPILKQK